MTVTMPIYNTWHKANHAIDRPLATKPSSPFETIKPVNEHEYTIETRH